ncbi:MAG: M3 family oligoendopeptidase [Armatimonadetes bacterium]|nr:M3 family oligoendopeptidase [Armatimonadota bacterium]
MTETTSPPHWDLTDLFSGVDDPRIDAALRQSLERAQQFEAQYREKITTPDLTPETLLQAIREYEALQQESYKPMAYAGLLYSADTSDPQRGALLQRMQEAGTQISLHLLFFELALLKMPEEQAQRLIDSPALDPYRHFLQTTRAFAGHDLSEPEERILEEKANTSSRAFARLFQEVTSNHVYTLEWEGETQKLNQAEILALLRRPERELRRRAAESFTAGLREQNRVLTYIFNTLVQDKALEDRLRRYESPEESRHLSNELDEETVETVMKICREHYSLVERFYRLKREILGYDTLTHYDRYAPLFDTQEKVEFPEARKMVLESFEEFAPAMRRTAEEFFEGCWIDAVPRQGKQGGAYCSYITPDLHPYIFMNYLNRLDDVMTLAHELGHGIHASLSRGQTQLNFHGTLPLAELASTFAEMLVFEKLQSGAALKDRLALYAEKIEGAFATIFRQAAMFRFEQKLHRARREQGELPSDAIGELWQDEMQSMFGDAVELGEDHRIWWSYIPHFIGSPFYVYAYSFGELLVFALYRMYQEQGEGFPDRYLDLLREGGSKSPHELMGQMGIDLRSPEFWRGGMEVLDDLVGRFEALYREYQAEI